MRFCLSYNTSFFSSVGSRAVDLSVRLIRVSRHYLAIRIVEHPDGLKPGCANLRLTASSSKYWQKYRGLSSRVPVRQPEILAMFGHGYVSRSPPLSTFVALFYVQVTGI